MANEENLKKPWAKGQSGNPNGRPKGSKNRSTIAKKWLSTKKTIKNPITGETEELTQEDIMTLAMIRKSINGSESAYDKLLYSAYGHHVQQIEQTITEQPLFPDVQEDESNK
jgi:hypothetical protein